ncbi:MULTISPECIES: ABC transporter substrate-binding protein [Micrococcus]|uniref:ABC transporter substrate-binding protein n=1 Tax=Micrococcus TaxID=1269 RepID=UPI000DFFD07D|nr:ABC transporter substrate-binding protein [Micrococcus luteus]STY72769.1 Glutathione-binding protein gsiB precursor [Micrococcus luteus]
MSILPSSPSRRTFLRFAGVATAAAGLAAGLSACGDGSSSPESGAGAPGADDAGTINASISYELGTNGYDPMTTSAALTVAANWHTLEGLTELDPATREPYAALAAELPTDTATSFDVALRKDAKFHDGSPVTADDVVFSFERVLDPANNSLYRSFIPFISAVEAKDAGTVSFTLTHPVALVAERLSVVKIVPKAAVEKDAEAFDASPVGSGPYRMTDNGAASGVIGFERFADYNGPKPARAALMKWNIMPDASARTNALTSGQVQAIDSVPYLSIPQLEATHSVESVQGFGMMFAMFNQSASSPFADQRARQAFLYALDVEEVIGTGLQGQATAATCFVQKEHPAYREAATVYRRDVEKAKALFADAGVRTFRLMATDHDWVKACTPIIQQNLQDAGVRVEFTERKSADAYNLIDGSADAYNVLIAPGDPSVFGNDADLLLRWWYAADTWTDTRMHWKDKGEYAKVQKLLDEGIKATDESAQLEAWHEVFDVVSAEVPLYPLLHRKAPTAWDPKTLVDFRPISLTGLSFVGVGSAT